MKRNIYKILVPAGIMAVSILLSVNGFSQDRRLPDGTIIYGDGTRRLPNGTVVYKRGTTRQRGTITRLPDGRVLYPNRSGRYPNDRSNNRRNNGQWLPPGQAKKIYGGRGRDYAPGQQKKWKKNDNGGEHGEEHGNHGRGEGHHD